MANVCSILTMNSCILFLSIQLPLVVFICSQFTYAIVVWNTLFTNQTKALMNYEQNYTTIAVIVIIMLIKSCNINIIIINNTIKILLSPSYKTNGKQTMYKARYITYINNFI